MGGWVGGWVLCYWCDRWYRHLSCIQACSHRSNTSARVCRRCCCTSAPSSPLRATPSIGSTRCSSSSGHSILLSAASWQRHSYATARQARPPRARLRGSLLRCKTDVIAAAIACTQAVTVHASQVFVSEEAFLELTAGSTPGYRDPWGGCGKKQGSDEFKARIHSGALLGLPTAKSQRRGGGLGPSSSAPQLPSISSVVARRALRLPSLRANPRLWDG